MQRSWRGELMWPKFDARIQRRWMHGTSRGGLVLLKIRSLDSEAWILWKRMRRSRGLMEGCCRKYGKFTTFERENARQLERNSMKYFFKRQTLRMSWTCVVSTNWTGFRVSTHGNYSNLQGQAALRLGLHEKSFNLFLFSAYTVTAT